MANPRHKGEGAQRYVVVGLGGIGGWLLRLLVPFLHSQGGGTVLAIDGDTFEPRNRARMAFSRAGNKAIVLAEELAATYGDTLTILPAPRYVNGRNVATLIGSGDIVFLQPDNHRTRRVVSRHCERLAEVALFSGGNDGVEDGKTGTFGNVQVYLRAGNRDLTNPITRYHPEIARPADQLPDAVGCGAALASAPQLLFTNAAVAAAMLGAFHAWRSHTLSYEEQYLDIAMGTAVPVRRVVASRKRERAAAAGRGTS